jgi:serine protease
LEIDVFKHHFVLMFVCSPYGKYSKCSGVAPAVDIYVVKVFDDLRNFHDFTDGTVYSTDLIAAAQLCKEAGADIISASLGGHSYDRFEDEYFRNLYEDDGILTIAAAGNGGNERNLYPAGYDFVFSVSAIDESRRVADFSTLNPSSTDILAPGK